MIRKLLSIAGIYFPRAGDVVIDRYDAREKTVEAVEGQRVSVAFFDGATLRRGSLLRRSIVFAR